MPARILMPALSPTMEKGTLAKWLVAVGDIVRPGDIIAEIETDKATMEVEAVDEGTVAAILVAAGTADVPVNTALAVLATEGDAAGEAATPGPPKQRADAAARPAPTETAEPAGLPQAAPVRGSAPHAAAAVPPSGGGPRVQTTTGATTAPAAGSAAGEPRSRIFATPLARGRAREGGVALAALRGSGPGGRIIAADVAAAMRAGVGGKGAAGGGASGTAAGAGGAATPPPTTGARWTAAGEDATARAAVPASPQQLAASGDGAATAAADAHVRALFEPDTYDLVPHDGMRRTIARRLTEAKQTVPHVYLTADCRLDALLALRAEINGAAPVGADGQPAYKVSVNDFVVKAFALALRTVPEANVAWTEAGMLRHRVVDVGVAVAIAGGLITPIIRRADEKRLSQLANEARDLAARARARKLKPNEYQGGSATVSNLGMYGVKGFGAIINPPQASILAVGAGEQRAVARDGAMVVATVLSVTLSIDHRALDGAAGAQLLAAFKALVENPARMLV